jgi:predicted DNA binding CopG/RHH family protein
MTKQHFKSKEEEFEYYSNLDLSEAFKRSVFSEVSFPNLKYSTEAISLRMPKYILWSVKERANTLDMPYQALIKKYIAEGVEKDKKHIPVN